MSGLLAYLGAVVVLLWFAGFSVLLAWLIFRDPAFDYRLVAVGALLPDLIDAPLGGSRMMHAVATAVLILVVVMIATRGRRVLRRRLLAIPIGLFLHLVLDGAWVDSEVFWWPASGFSFGDIPLPAEQRGIALLLMQEFAGALALGWCVQRFGLLERGELQRFLRTGRLNRELVR